MRAILFTVTALLLGLDIAVATAANPKPAPTSTTLGWSCGHVADVYGGLARCSIVQGNILQDVTVSNISCKYTPAPGRAITGKAVVYAGQSVSNDGAGTFQFSGSPQVAPELGTFSFGEQRVSVALPGKPAFGLLRWGTFIYSAAKFYPSNDWMGDLGSTKCKSISPQLDFVKNPQLPNTSVQQWAFDVLNGLGVPTDATNIDTMVKWATKESGGGNPNVCAGRWNPLNSTEAHHGAVCQGGAQGDIKGYADYQNGVKNIVWNLTKTPNAGYEAIIAALRTSNQAATFAAISRSSFGTHF